MRKLLPSSSIMPGMGSTPRAEMANIHVIEEGECVDQEVIVQYTQIMKQHKNFWNLANQDWVRAQSCDPVIPQVIKWINRPKEDRRKLEEYLAGVASDYEKQFYIARQKEFALQDKLLYLQVTPTNSQDMVPVFVILTGGLASRYRWLPPIVRGIKAVTAP